MESTFLMTAAGETEESKVQKDGSEQMEEEIAVDDACIDDTQQNLLVHDTGPCGFADSKEHNVTDSMELKYSALNDDVTSSVAIVLDGNSANTFEVHGCPVLHDRHLPGDDVDVKDNQPSNFSGHEYRQRRIKWSRWFYSNRFQRYWKHYRKVWAWFQKHQVAQYKARCEAKWQEDIQKWYKSLHLAGYDPWAAYMYMYYMPMLSQYAVQPEKADHRGNKPPGNGSDSMEQNDMQKIPSLETLLAKGTVITNSATGTPGRSNKSKRKRKSRSRKARKKKMALGMENATSSDPEHEEEVLEMEITEDMLDFFAHSAKHRKERDNDKEDDGKNWRGGDKPTTLEGENKLGRATEEAPSERPGVRRTFEMKSLYGRGAAMIHGMETAIQLNFDRNSDIRQPKFWPALPLNIKFD